jgi:hypothetical protein
MPKPTVNKSGDVPPASEKIWIPDDLELGPIQDVLTDYIGRQIWIALRVYLGERVEEYDTGCMGPWLDIRPDDDQNPCLNFSPTEPLDGLSTVASLFDALCEAIAWARADIETERHAEGDAALSKLRAVLSDSIEIIDGQRENPAELNRGIYFEAQQETRWRTVRLNKPPIGEDKCDGS